MDGTARPIQPSTHPAGLSFGGNDMGFIRKLLGFDDPLVGEFSLRVQPIVHGGFGVYANAVLLAIHNDQAAADEHCQQLLGQQLKG
jgi:hypothetical protein